jgi:hypothetical protein
MILCVGSYVASSENYFYLELIFALKCALMMILELRTVGYFNNEISEFLSIFYTFAVFNSSLVLIEISMDNTIELELLLVLGLILSF